MKCCFSILLAVVGGEAYESEKSCRGWRRAVESLCRGRRLNVGVMVAFLKSPSSSHLAIEITTA